MFSETFETKSSIGKFYDMLGHSHEKDKVDYNEVNGHFLPGEKMPNPLEQGFVTDRRLTGFNIKKTFFII